jgi:hypothetical protein
VHGEIGAHKYPHHANSTSEALRSTFSHLLTVSLFGIIVKMGLLLPGSFHACGLPRTLLVGNPVNRGTATLLKCLPLLPYRKQIQEAAGTNKRKNEHADKEGDAKQERRF